MVQRRCVTLLVIILDLLPSGLTAFLIRSPTCFGVPLFPTRFVRLLGSSVATLKGHNDYIRSVEFHPRLPLLLSSSDDRTVRLWNFERRELIAVLVGHLFFVMCARFHPRKPLIASVALDRSVVVWDFSNLPVHVPGGGVQLAGNLLFQGQPTLPVKQALEYAEMSLQFASMVSTSPLFSEELGDLTVFIPAVAQLYDHEDGVNWVDFHPTLSLMVTGSDDLTVRLWRVDLGGATCLEVLRGHGHNVSCVVFHPTEAFIVSNSEDRTLRVWDYSGAPVAVHEETGGRCWHVATHRPSGHLASCHDTGVLVFKLHEDRPVYDHPKPGLLLYPGDSYLMRRPLMAGRAGQGDGSGGGPGAPPALPLAPFRSVTFALPTRENQRPAIAARLDGVPLAHAYPSQLHTNPTGELVAVVMGGPGPGAGSDGGRGRGSGGGSKRSGGSWRVFGPRSGTYGLLAQGTGADVAWTGPHQLVVLGPRGRSGGGGVTFDVHNLLAGPGGGRLGATSLSSGPMPVTAGPSTSVTVSEIDSALALYPAGRGSVLVKDGSGTLHLVGVESGRAVAQSARVGIDRALVVRWTATASYVALLGAHGVRILDGQLRVCAVLHETVKTLGGVWIHLGGPGPRQTAWAFLYSTLNQLKYLLPSGEHGALLSLPQPMAAAGHVRGHVVLLTLANPDPRVVLRPLSLLEPTLRAALALGLYPSVRRSLRVLAPLRQGEGGGVGVGGHGHYFLQLLADAGLPGLALHYARTPLERIRYAAQAGTLDAGIIANCDALAGRGAGRAKGAAARRTGRAAAAAAHRHVAAAALRLGELAVAEVALQRGFQFRGTRAAVSCDGPAAQAGDLNQRAAERARPARHGHIRCPAAGWHSPAGARLFGARPPGPRHPSCLAGSASASLARAARPPALHAEPAPTGPPFGVARRPVAQPRTSRARWRP